MHDVCCAREFSIPTTMDPCPALCCIYNYVAYQPDKAIMYNQASQACTLRNRLQLPHMYYLCIQICSTHYIASGANIGILFSHISDDRDGFAKYREDLCDLSVSHT